MEDYIKTLSTKELCDELAQREGVELVMIHPHDVMTIEADGPAIMFIVTD